MKYRVVKYTNPQTGVSAFAIQEKWLCFWVERMLGENPYYYKTEEEARKEIERLSKKEDKVKLIKEILK
jgi:hypothetical protein